MKDFIIPFLTILLAEFGDKTQLAVLTMSSKTKKRLNLFFGVILAFIIVDGLAIYFGEFIVNYVDMFWIKLISGVLFLIFGLLPFILKEKDEKDEILNFKSPFISGFLIIFLAEMGDKSQISSAMFASIYNAWIVFFAVILALIILTVLAIYVGEFIIKKFNKKKIEFIANSVFIIIGLLTLISLI